MDDTPRVLTKDEAKAYALRCDIDEELVLKWREKVEKCLAEGAPQMSQELLWWQNRLVRFGAVDEAALRRAKGDSLDDPVIPKATVKGRKTRVRSLKEAKACSGSPLVSDVGYSLKDYEYDHTFAGIRSDLEKIIESELPPLHGELEGVDPFDVIGANLGAALKDGLKAWESYLDTVNVAPDITARVTLTTKRAAYLLDELADIEAELQRGVEAPEYALCRAIRLGELIERTKNIPYVRFAQAGVRESVGGERSAIAQRVPKHPTWAEFPEHIKDWARQLYQRLHLDSGNKSEACRNVSDMLGERGYAVGWQYLRKIFSQ